MFLKIIQFLVYLPFKIFYPTRIIGRKNLPKGKAILASNHRSNIDVAIFVTGFFKKQYYLAKKELFNTKIKKAIFKALGAIPVNRANVELSTIKEALRVLKNNRRLIIFPEGTRNKNDNLDLGEVKNGIVLFSTKAKAPIVPVWIQKKPRLFRFNRMIIGKPFTLEEFYDKKLTSEEFEIAGEIVKEKMLELRGGGHQKK